MSKNNLKNILIDVHEKYKNVKDGLPASYIPELSNVDPDQFSIALTLVNGETISVGHSDTLFTMQSTSKPLVYGLALQQSGESLVHSKVGVEPTGEAFNSIIELEEKSHRPFNPMINSGAIATTSLINGSTKAEKLKTILNHLSKYVGRDLGIDEKVFISEKKTAHRNRAISYLMKHFQVLEADIEDTLDLYFQQCSILMNTIDLSKVAATLANSGVNPINSQIVLLPENVSRMLSLMFSCGMYDSAGEWAYHVGLPAKSGVSGALFAVVPGQLGLAVYSPRIDQKGHSIREVLQLKK